MIFLYRVKEKRNFQILETLFDLVYFPYYFNAQGRLDETSKRLIFGKLLVC